MKKMKNIQDGGPSEPKRLVHYLLTLQRRTANYLNRKTAQWTAAQLKLALITFCLVTGNASLFLLSRAISGNANSPPLIPSMEKSSSSLKGIGDSIKSHFSQPFKINNDERSKTK